MRISINVKKKNSFITIAILISIFIVPAADGAVPGSDQDPLVTLSLWIKISRSTHRLYNSRVKQCI